MSTVRMSAPVVPEIRDDELMVTISPMRKRDLRQVHRIETEVHASGWSYSTFLAELSIRTVRAYYVARIGGKIVGYAGLMRLDDEAHVTTIAVDAGWQRHKIATRLLATCLRHGMLWQANGLTLEVRVSNKAAQAMYLKFGFAPEGVRRAYYTDSGEDAIIMWLRELDSAKVRKRLEEIEAAVPGRTEFEAVSR